jgi:hypothetical protein
VVFGQEVPGSFQGQLSFGCPSMLILRPLGKRIGVLGPIRPQPSRVSSSKKRWTWKVERSVAQFTRHGGETVGNEPAGVSTLGAGQLWHFSWSVVIRTNKEHTHTTARLQGGSSTKLLPRDRFDRPVCTNPLTVAHTAALESAYSLSVARRAVRQTCRASFRYRNPDISSGSQTVSTSVS